MTRPPLIALLSLVALCGCEIRIAQPTHGPAPRPASCTRDCWDRWCGEADGCGGYCTACPGTEICVDALCVADAPTTCYPAEGQCGWDGCGGWLGGCFAGYECSGNWCWATEACTPDCSWGCGDDGCGGWCGDCWDDQTCTPDCSWGCGDDGCGGWCGDCWDDTCTPDCSWGCGDDGCGGWCGDC